MKLKAIINPSSGRENSQTKLRQMLRTLHDERILSSLKICSTGKAGDGVAYAQSEDTADYDILLVAGGDGTVHEVVNGLVKGKHQTPLAILAAGTVNDFAHAMSLPQNVEEMRDLLIHHTVKWVDVGQAGDQGYFLNVCAGGVATDVAYTTSREMKAVLGRFAYILNGVITAPAGIFNPGHYRIQFPDEVIEEELLVFLVANSQSVGGFHNIMPQGSATDGLLDFLALRSLQNINDVGQFLTLFNQIKQGRHIESPIMYYRQTPWLEIEELTGKKIVLDYDGEEGDELPIRLEVKARAIPLLVPET